MPKPGQIIILNGAPRSGKSSIARAVQEGFEGVWVNLGVDAQMASLPMRFHPGIGLRPGGERPEVEAIVPCLWAALYESIAAYSRLGLNVVSDVGHHDAYSKPLHLLEDCARRIAGLPALFVGVRCPVEAIMARRALSREGQYLTGVPGDPVPEPIMRWQTAVHRHDLYDLEVDTSLLSARACAAQILAFMRNGAERLLAFEKLAGVSIK